MQSTADLRNLLEVANADFERISIYPNEAKDFALHIREQSDGRWAVYLVERGVRSSEITFDHFWQAACYFLGSVYAEPACFTNQRLGQE